MLNRLALLTVVVTTCFSSPALAQHWDTQFGSASPFPVNAVPNGLIRDVLVDGDDVYICGDFTALGSTPVSEIAHWDGTSWSDMGLTLTGELYLQPAVNCLAKYKQWIVAAGWFLTVNGESGNIALWDGSQWSVTTVKPDNSINQHFYAMVSDDTYLYIADGDYGGIAKWDGTTSQQLTGSFGPDVYTLLLWNGDLYAGGPFSGHVARFDGTWHAVGTTGLANLIPVSLLVHDDTLYAIGNGNVSYLNGSSWVAAMPQLLPCDLTGGGEGMFLNDRLYMMGPRGTTYNSVAVSNGSVWQTMGSGLSPSLCFPQIAEYQGKPLIAGQFNTADGVPAPGMALWSLPGLYSHGLSGPVNSLATSGSDVFAVGQFESAFDAPAHGAARWDGNAWQALGAGIDGQLNAVEVIGTDVYVGGYFTLADGGGIINLAKWDGSSWSPVGLPLAGVVFALDTDGTSLYVGGSFTTFQNESLNGIARWDGSAFHALGQGAQNGPVRTILVDGNRVYAGGDFLSAGNNIPTGNIAYYDGDWHAMGNGFNGTVRDLELHQGVIFAAGDFTTGSLNRIAAWDGSAWVSLPFLNGSVYSMVSAGDALYVSGDFTTAGGVPTSHIAKWQSLNWYSLGAGLDLRANALALGTDGIYAGGPFRTAGGNTSYHFARWTQVASGVTPSLRPGIALESIFPNPFNPNTTIRYRVDITTRVTLGIHDVQGRLVRQLLDKNVAGSAQQQVVTWDGTDDRGQSVASGVYFVRMRTPAFAESRKIVLLK